MSALKQLIDDARTQYHPDKLKAAQDEYDVLRGTCIAYIAAFESHRITNSGTMPNADHTGMIYTMALTAMGVQP